MGTIFSISPDKNLLLYSVNSSVCLRTATGMEITRPLILCNDFTSSLSCVVYHDIPYYTYLNTEGELLLRNVFDNSILFQLSSNHMLTYHSPLLCVCEEELFLLFFMENPMSGKHILKYTLPLKPGQPSMEISTFSTLPRLQCLSQDSFLLLLCSTPQKEELFIKSGDLFEPVYLKKKQELEEGQKLIESVQKQYEELMNTAYRYREEAEKWYTRYYSGK